MGFKNVMGVVTGGRRTMTDREAKIHANLRSLIWERMREWLATASIPEKHPRLATDLTTPGFTYHKRTHLQVIESKEDIRARGAASPDFADALALTFGELVSNNYGGGGSYEPDVT